MKKLSKTEAKEEINEFFSNIKNKSQKDIQKIKKLVMRHNIALKEKRKTFCKECFSPFLGDEKIRIKNRIKNITCKRCNYINRWKVR